MRQGGCEREVNTENRERIKSLFINLYLHINNGALSHSKIFVMPTAGLHQQRW